MVMMTAYLALVCAGCIPVNQPQIIPTLHARTLLIAKRSRRSRAWAACRRKYGKRLTGVTLKKRNRFTCHYRKSKAQIRASCRKRYGRRFIRLSKTRKGYSCVYNPGRKQFTRMCKRKYGRRYLRVIRKKGQNICIYQPSERQMITTCKKRHGKRYLRLSKSKGRYHCVYRMDYQQAYAQCNKTYGDRFQRMTEKQNGTYSCWFKPTFEEAVSQCRKNHGDRLIDVIRRDKRYICRFSPDKSDRDKNFSTPDDRSADPKGGEGFNERYDNQGPGFIDQQPKLNPAFPLSPDPAAPLKIEKDLEA